MNVKFFTEDGKVKADGSPVEFVSISGDFMGKDEVVREATDDDRRRYHMAYEEFKNPPPEAAVPAVPPAGIKTARPARKASRPSAAAPPAPAVPAIDPAGKVT